MITGRTDWFGVLLCGVVLLACGDSTSPGRREYSVSPAAQWSGGAVQVTSESFANLATPVFTAEGETLAVFRSTNLTVTVRLPTMASGPVTLFREGSRRDSVGTVEVVGVRSARLVSGSLGFEPLVPEAVTPPVFVAEATPTGAVGLTILDPAADQVTPVSGVSPVQTSFGILPTYQSNRFVLRDSANRLGVWELFPAKAFQELAAVQSGAVRHVTRLADTLWLTLLSNAYQFTTPSGTTTFSGISDPLRAVFSPAGDRLALVMASAPTGHVPVLDPATGDSAFTVPLPSAQGVAFSPNGDRLYLSSRSSGGMPDSLVAVSAADGQRLAGSTLPSGYAGWNLVADPQADRLYQVADSSGTLALLVFTRSTLALEGQLVCPGQCGNANFWSAGLAVDPAAGRIHVAYPGTPIPLITFNRLP